MRGGKRLAVASRPLTSCPRTCLRCFHIASPWGQLCNGRVASPRRPRARHIPRAERAAQAVARGARRAPTERDASDTETFQWDGLALIQRGDEQFINEPHVGGGNPVAFSKGTSYFNDALGTTLGAKKDGKYSAAALTAFGENLSVDSPTPTQNSNFFTGKPYVEGLGHAFLMRNYRAGLAKWQTADPMGYPDGWNQLAYCGNASPCYVDYIGCLDINLFPPHEDIYSYASQYVPNLDSEITVGGHGSARGMAARSVLSLANEIRGLPKYNTDTSVWLYSCNVGNGDFAQKLANELRVTVYAPSSYVWFSSTGYIGIFDRLPNGDIDYSTPGGWLAFRPE